MKSVIDEKLFLQRISDLDSSEKSFLLRLKKKYDYYNVAFKDEKDMIDAENRIYTVNGITLGDSKRISIELSRIDEYLNTNDSIKLNNDELTEIAIRIKEISSFNKELDDNIEDTIIITKLKKNISYIQTVLGLKTNFFKATKELFLDNYNNLVVNEIESKKVR